MNPSPTILHGGGRRPRLLLMTDGLTTGGTERQFALLAGALRAGRFEVRLGCLRREGAFLDEVGKVEEFNPGGSFLSLRGLAACRRLAGYLRAQRVAIAHSFDYYSNLLMIPAARRARVPVVIGSLRNLGDRRNPLKAGMHAEMLRLCTRVVCNSAAAARRLASLGLPADNVVLIPNALPEEAFRQAAPLIPRGGAPRVGMIARMNNPVKNYPLFLRACRRLLAEFPSLEILLAGDGPLRPGLEELARQLGLAARTRFLGEQRDVAAALASLDVSVVASRSESLSNVILESMAAGVPVVASDVGGNPELVRHAETGLLFPSEDEEALAAALAALLRDPRRSRAMGARGKEIARREYHLQSVQRRFEDLYAGLLDEAREGAEARRHAGRPARSPGTALRVAIVAPALKGVGGQAVQADLLLRRWRETPGVEASLIPINPEFPPGLRWAEAVPYLRTVMRTPLYLRSLWRGLGQADVAHIFSASYWSFLLAPAPALWIAHRLGVKALINYRSGEARDHLANWRTAVPILRRADCLVTPSGYLRDVFAEFGLEARVIANIVDLDQFRYRQRRPLRPLLVCTRGCEPYYSVDVVVRAFAEVRRSHPEARLCLAGGGSLEGKIRELVRELGLEEAVEFAGRVPRERIGECYDRADIFINASWLDNMPGSILEAFAAGTPVVSTGPEGIRYIVEHERTGLLSEPGDAAALAANVLRLLREPELAAALAENAFEESRRYRWEAVRDAWLGLYAELAGARRAGHPAGQPVAGPAPAAEHPPLAKVK